MDNIIEVTESAQNHINKILLSEKSKFFRITVLGGGCAGFQYKFDFSDKPCLLYTSPSPRDRG